MISSAHALAASPGHNVPSLPCDPNPSKKTKKK